MKLILTKIKEHLGLFLTAIFFLTVESLSDLLQPTLMSHIVDDGVKNQDVGTVLYFGGIMLGVAFIGAAGAVIRNNLSVRTSQQIGKELRSELYRKIQSFSFENIDRLHPASLITRITNDVTQIQNFINGTMRILVKAPITCIGAIILIVTQTPRQIPMIVVILVISTLLIAGNMRFGYPRFVRLQRRLDRLNSVSREFLTSIRVVKAFGREDYETGRFSTAAEELAASGISATRVTAVFGPMINLTVNIGIVVLLWLGGTGGQQDVGKLMASVNYMTQVLFALSMVSNILNTMVRATASAERVQEVLSEKPAMREPEMPIAERPDGSVAFENVSFSYIHSPEKSLDNVSFCVESGQVLGIIGATGSGKSTLVSLIPRFYDVTGGRVLVGGRDVRSQKTSQLREAIGMVPQKSLLFSGTIRDNLKWGDPDADDRALDAAAHAACADEFINSFSKGYDTVLGQGGVNLSGGQKQRLSIARALIRHPAILVMDDSTSALDATTEAVVMNRIREYARGTTVILISQRIASVMRADKILCMDEGRVSGLGPHEALMAESPVYREIYKSQIGDDEHASR